MAQAVEQAALVQVASCSASSALDGIAEVRWTAGRAEWAQVEWAVCRAMKVRVASRTCGPGQSRRNGREKRKSPESRWSPDRFPTGWGSPIGMNSAQPIAAERIRCSWGVKECAAMGPVGRNVGALVMG